MLSPSRQRGITLIEVVITIALAAILLFTVAPSVSSMITNGRLRSSAESVQQGIQRARNEALKRNQDVSLWFVTTDAAGNLDNGCALSAASKAWVVSIDNPAGACAASVSDTVAPRVLEKSAGNAAGTNVTLTAFQVDGVTPSSSVMFDGFGRVTSGTAVGRINLSSAVGGEDLRAMRILLSRGGSLRTCEPGVSDTSDPRYCPL